MVRRRAHRGEGGRGLSSGNAPGRARPARVLLVLVVVLSLAAAGRVTWVAAVPTGDAVRASQVRHLDAALAAGAGADMQKLFPEGFFFTHVLTGLAAAQPAAPGEADALRTARAALAALDSPAGLAPFPPDARPAYGAFWAGWSLVLATEVARVSGLVTDRDEVAGRAARIRDALAADDDGFLESYPGQVWPVDTTVAVAALARANAVVPVPGAADAVAGWTARTAPVRDVATGLLPHRLAADGTVLDGPRGSSQAVIQVFEPDIDPVAAARDHRRFVGEFVVRRAGLVGVLEYPRGTSGAGDVDSGPLVAGVSLSASAVALGASRRQGDTGLAATLDAEAELFGLPVGWPGERSYGFGQLPVADAFLAWSRSQQPVAGGTGPTGAPTPLWPAWVLFALLPAVLLLAFRRPRAVLLGRPGRPATAG